jgi:hypothetical protein
MKEIQNYYYLLINSADNDSQNTNCKNLNFNLGNVLQSAPNSQQIQDAPYCYVKVKYFVLNESPINYTTTNTIQIRVNKPFPNSFETKRNGVDTTNILGVVPTGVIEGSNYYIEQTYSNPDYDNNYVVMGNIFNGSLNIQLTDQSGTLLADTHSNNKSYVMYLEIYFPDMD